MASTFVEAFPPYMELGSTGSAVNLVLGMLIGWAKGQGIHDHGVICDGTYGDRGTNLMKRFQSAMVLDADGGCGPQTRRFLKEDMGFDFEFAATVTGGMTSFVQPDGEILRWGN